MTDRTTTLPVLVARDMGPVTFERLYSGLEVRHGVLTTDHATSSHNLPVLLIDGVPHGPGDLADGTYLEVSSEHRPPSPVLGYAEWLASEHQIVDMLQRAKSAGYQVSGYLP